MALTGPEVAFQQLAFRAKWAGVFGGLVWGTFWVPVRLLDEAGVTGLWAVALLYGLGALCSLPLLAWRWRRVLAGGWRLQLTGVILGLAIALYGAAFLYTDVASAVLLFYLSPVWGFLLGRIVLRDPVTPVRWLAMVLALGGAAIVLGGSSWPPLPSNPGDWLALASGLLYVIGSLMMLTWRSVPASDYTLSFLVWAGVAMLLLAPLLEGSQLNLEAVVAEFPWLLAFVLLVLLPGCYAAVFGASVLNPGVVGILYMTEIGVSLLLAALITDEVFGWREGIGIGLIALAGALEGLIGLWRLAKERRRVTLDRA
ncbi:MAG: DMT family transporter [Pseudomonadota bacterium]